MRASKPNISAPLSRSKKSNSILSGPLVILGVIFLVISLTGILFYASMMNNQQQQQQEQQNIDSGIDDDAPQQPDLRNKLVNLKKPLNHNDATAKVYLRDTNNNIDKERDEERYKKTHPIFKWKETLVIETRFGKLRIVFRPEFSPESVMYIKDIIETGECKRCAFYRAEKPGIFQGIIKSDTIQKVASKGACPEEYLDKKQNCPKHDPNCACHGPTMTHGMVAWAGGGTGPDFFIDSYKNPAKFWGQQHTVWGEIMDSESFDILDEIFKLPVTNKGGMNFLDENIKFTMSIESSSGEEI